MNLVNTQATEVIGDELQAPKVDGFTQGESNAGLVIIIGDDGGFWWMNHWNVQQKACYNSSLLAWQL
jgi:hypothetical protein